MRAVVYERYGGPEVLHLEEVPIPTPGDDQLLVEVHAATVNRTDCGFLRAKPFIVRFFAGLRRPRRPILGSEFAGTVTAVGPAVRAFAVGDEVFGVHEGMGAHAEFLCVAEGSPVAPKPSTMTFEEAAAISDGVVLAGTLLRAADVQKGQRVLVYGASGSIGTATVQLAKHLGAHVTAVCNTDNVAVVGSLGADEVVDYLTDDFTASGQTYDVILDTVGKLPYRRCRRSLARRGIFISTDLGFLCQNPLLALVSRRVKFPLPKYTKDAVVDLAALVEQGAYRAVIDRRYPLDDVPEAFRYVETETKTGNVVITVKD